MKQLLYIPLNSYFFRGKTNPAMLKRCLNQYGRHFCAVTGIQVTRQEVLIKPMTLLKKQENIYVKKKFSSYPGKNLILMDFDVWLYPKLFLTFKSLYYFFFVLKEMDGGFSVAEFNRSTVTALQVVTTLLSQLRFSELEGLLTQSCIEEVERNLKNWPKDQISILAIEPGNVIRISPCDVAVFSDENSGKEFVEIRVIHYVWMKYSPKFENFFVQNTHFGRTLSQDLQNADFNNLYMCGIFNTKFIREFTEGVSDQWTINAINVKCFSNVITSSK